MTGSNQTGADRKRLLLYAVMAGLFLGGYFGLWQPFQRWTDLKQQNRKLLREIRDLKEEYEALRQEAAATPSSRPTREGQRQASEMVDLLQSLIRPERADFRYQLIEFLDSREEEEDRPVIYLHIRGSFRRLRDFLDSIENKPTLSIETAGMKKSGEPKNGKWLELKLMARLKQDGSVP